MNRRGFTQTATIASSGTESSVINLVDAVLVHVYLPAAFTGTSLSFKGSYDGTNFFAIHDLDGAVALPVAQGNCYRLPDDVLTPFLRVVSNGAEGGVRTIFISTKQ